MTITVAPDLVETIGESAESWLRTRTAASPEQPIIWCPHGSRGGGEAVRSLEHLSVLISHLPEPGEWAVVEWAGGDVRRWCQTMRHPSGWVVDAHDGTANDFAMRVFRGAPGDYPKAAGRRPAYGFELWQPWAAADVMWTWLHGNLPEGCSRTMRHMISPVLDHGLGQQREPTESERLNP